MKQRVYIDTSIVGGFFDEEFSEATKKLFERLIKGEIIFVLSDLMGFELTKAPLRVKKLLSKYPQECFEHVELTEESVNLANLYIKEGVVGKANIEDCRHIAIATINKVDVLASWNFKHIVNLDKIKGYNSVNYRYGYQMIEIRSPKDLIYYEN
ncbi:MAG: type II toxin-antitoxin system VapC family toxin [Chlorobi bacterium]|nr:type II toxin-antitoxin system VapC family toxin [Chlorobiota bacterium]